MVMGNHISNYSRLSQVSRDIKHLEHAGFLIEQNDKGLWLVRYPIKSPLTGDFVYYRKAYQKKGNAINHAKKRIRQVIERQESYNDLGAEWQLAIERYQNYKPDFTEIW